MTVSTRLPAGMRTTARIGQREMAPFSSVARAETVDPVRGMIVEERRDHREPEVAKLSGRT